MRNYLPSEDVVIKMASTPEERERIYRFRYQIYVEEMRYWLTEVNHKKRMICDEFDEWGVIFYATDKNKIVGTLRVNIGGQENFPQGLKDDFFMENFLNFQLSNGLSNQVAFSSKLMIAPDYRGSHLFNSLWSLHYNICRKKGVLFDFRGTAANLVMTQELLGARRYKGNIKIKDYGYMVLYVLLLDDVEHFKKVNSPFLQLASQYKNTSGAANWFNKEFPISKYLNNKLVDVWEVMTKELGNFSPGHIFSLFHGLNEEEIRICVGYCHLVYCEKEDVIVYPADISREIFMIASGGVSVRIRGKNGGQLTYELTNGQTFGARAFINDERYKITVTAITDTHLLVLSRSKFEKMAAMHPETAKIILKNLESINY